MKVFEFAGVIFNADNICTVQKVTMMDKGDEEKKIPDFQIVTVAGGMKIPGFQIVTVAGGMNFTFKTEKERDEKFDELLKGMETL